MTITCSVLVDAPVSKVYEVFSDLEGTVERIPAITKVEIVEGDKEFGAGTKWKETRDNMGKEATMEIWVTAAKKDEFYTAASEGYGYEYVFTYTFTEEDGKTKVTLDYNQKAQNIFATIMSPISLMMKGQMTKLFLEDMEILGKAAEQEK